jgi:tripartite-type tricarboxylate transporter receptor subunit TctC
LLTPAVTLAPWLSRRMDCTPADFAPIGRISFSPAVLAVRAGAPYAGVADLLARRAAHEELAVPAPFDWDPPQVGQALFLARAGLSAHAVAGLTTPAERMAALLAGDVDLAFAPLDQVLDPGIAARLRALGVSGPSRVPRMPAVPSLREAGFDVPVGAWHILALLAESPRSTVEGLGETLRTIMESPRLRAELTGAGLAPAWLGPDETTRALLTEYREAGTLFTALGLSVRKEVLGLGSG